MTTDFPHSAATAAPWGDVPPPRVDPDARRRIRQARAEDRHIVAVLDDDPTGSQSVHGVQVVTVPDPEQYPAALDGDAPTCFVLTNSRSLAEPDAVRLTETAATDLLAEAARQGRPIDLVSRSDSTLRGHVWAEICALHRARTAVHGAGYDGVLLVPAYLEAGRVTAGDTHWARVGGRFVPVGETEFARDATFGYRSSDLRDFVAEASRGAVPRDRVRAIGLADIREHGPERVADILTAAEDGAIIVVNALDYADLETVALGVLAARRAGRNLAYRSGPSFVRALAGQDPRPPVTAAEIRAAGRPAGHGLVVVGSHVGQTSRQLAVLRERTGLAEIELDVPALLAADRPDPLIDAAAERVTDALRRSHVLLMTSRALVTGRDREDSLRLARRVSDALCRIVRTALAAEPAWLLAKGGITSHDLAVRGLGIRRAEVVGQLFPGMVSLFRPTVCDPRFAGRPYVVFAGNVGDDDALADAVHRLAEPGPGEQAGPSGPGE